MDAEDSSLLAVSGAAERGENGEGERERVRDAAAARKERVIDNHRAQERTRGMISRLPLTRE